MRNKEGKLFFILLMIAVLMFVIPLQSMADTRPNAIIDCDRSRQDESTCLACNIYHESASEPFLGMMAVGLVTKNRVLSNQYPDSFCSVTWESRRHYKTKKLTPQFSWTLDGKPDRVYIKKAWEVASSIAQGIVSGNEYPDITAGAMHYHADYVDPDWASQLYPTVRIGRHFFYALNEETAYGAMETNYIQKED